ncbi:hypothetical protein ACVW1A_006958 [Bradyrhizobium sp. LB1.3]
MSNTEIADRDGKGRFQIGHKPGPGRPVGARSRLGEAFISDLQSAWETHGADVIARVIRDDPSVMLKVVAGLLPKDINLSVEHSVDAQAVLLDFRRAVELLQSDQLRSQAKVLNARRS